ncbi:hypothetical protein [Parafrigoribacterium soli]|uniref:hypothetical protein n=1 Tax=Parafrigoribacterium soli TaxID=3144663 RepID=UPI0032F0507E
MAQANEQPVPIRGPLAFARGILTLGAVLFIGWNLLSVFVALTFIGSNSQAFTFPVLSTDATATPASIAPDAFGYFREATFSSSAFSWWPHAWNTLGVLLGAVVSIAVAVLVTGFAKSASQGLAFRRNLSRSLIAGAIVIGLGGTLSRAALLIAQQIAFVEVTTAASNTLIMPTAIVPADWMPLLVGAAIALLAVVVRYGERLQRDTEGLV